MEIKKYFTDSRIFAKNNELCLFPTIGCFIKGYILLSTIQHYISLYNCPDETVFKINNTIKIIRNAFKIKMGTGMVFFEHGTVDDYSLSSASVSHFHMHFLPAHETIWDQINKKFNFSYHKLDNISDVKTIVNQFGIKSYLLFGDFNGDKYLIDCTKENFPSQFLRKVTYEYYYGEGDNKWNWREFPFYETMMETIEVFTGIEI